jgi:hypothetical protein
MVTKRELTHRVIVSLEGDFNFEYLTSLRAASEDATVFSTKGIFLPVDNNNIEAGFTFIPSHRVKNISVTPIEKGLGVEA